MNEIWKEYKLDFKSTGLLVSNHGNVKTLHDCSRTIVTGKQIGRASCRERVSSPV